VLACRQRNKPCISLSHQCAVLNKHAPKPKRKDFIGKAVLNFYAPTTHSYGFHFHRYDKNIFTPVIRSEVRALPIEDRGHYTVYLPSYDDTRIIKMLKNFGHINWEVFSKHTNKCYVSSNVCIQPIENDKFIGSMASSKGVLCGAGFETPAEALFLKKKLAVIPMKMQYEQQCNAAALKDMGVPVYLLSDTLNLSVAQRLLRLLCPHCKKETPFELTENLARFNLLHSIKT
jgi:uncharacterized protein (TIGR00661 family)